MKWQKVSLYLHTADNDELQQQFNESNIGQIELKNDVSENLLDIISEVHDVQSDLVCFSICFVELDVSVDGWIVDYETSSCKCFLSPEKLCQNAFDQLGTWPGSNGNKILFINLDNVKIIQGCQSKSI